MNRYCKTGLLLLAAFSLVCCKEENFKEGKYQEKVVSFTLGNDATATKALTSCAEAQVANYAIGDVYGNELLLVETVSSADNLYSTDSAETKGTPVYTENFDSLYGEQVYATAFVPKSGTVKLTDPWGDDFGDNGTVKLNKTAANTYSYNYRDQSATHVGWSLRWPEDGELLYFIQAPYATTDALNPEFYSDGSIQFDYTDPTAPITVETRPTIVNGASAQKDILFTSKIISEPEDHSLECHANILMYHALTAVKFKAGNVDMEVETKITKVTFKGIKANGHCTIKPNYADANTSAGDNPSNAGGKLNTKSSACSVWTSQATDLVVDYSQSFDGTVDYTGENSHFGESFYKDGTDLKNLGSTTDGSEILLMVPQTLTNVEVVVDFTIDGKPFSRSVQMSGTWKAGELHTYTLTVNKVDVEITDQMNEALTQKTSVVTKNSGNVTAYLRATYALAWYYGYGDDAICVAAYQGGTTGFKTGDNPNQLSQRWIKGSDGFYYYPWPVAPGRATGYALFTSFTAPAASQTGPFVGSHLELNILLQGVQYDENMEKVSAAWGNVFTVDEAGNPTTTPIVSVLSADIEDLMW